MIEPSVPLRPKLRKYLNADALYRLVYGEFTKIFDVRVGDVKISVADASMSALAMFLLKDPSVLAFDERRKTDQNLGSIYHIGIIPSDTQMRTILDDVDPVDLRSAYKVIFRQLQRGKILESFVFLEDCYLLSLDGTGIYSSHKIRSDACLVKTNSKTGEKTYSLQMLGAALIHPDRSEVIPLVPEMITKQDGETKNDCERNAARRFVERFRKEHPFLPVIVTEDALSPNAPHIRDLQTHNVHYILGVKPGDHQFLFDYVRLAHEEGLTTEHEIVDPIRVDVRHRFRFLTDVPLNKSNLDVHVHFVEYWEISPEGIKHFTWVTDIVPTPDNVYLIMRGGRARWKIENETFNTLKNQGYHLGHNYGLGKKNLGLVFTILMMLAFLIDQTQQIGCPLFRSVWKKLGSKRALWEAMRSVFRYFQFDSMEMLYRALLHGIKFKSPELLLDSS